MISSRPVLFTLVLAFLLFHVGFGQTGLSAKTWPIPGNDNRVVALLTQGSSCATAGCNPITSKAECLTAANVLAGSSQPKAVGPQYVSGGGTHTTTSGLYSTRSYDGAPRYCWQTSFMAGAPASMHVFSSALSTAKGECSAQNQCICSCPKPAASAQTETCEALQAECTKYNDKCGSTSGGSNSGGSNSGGSNSGGSNSGGSNSGGSNSGGSNSGGSNSGGSNSGGDSTSGGGGGGGGDTPVNKLITDVTTQIDNNPEDPMVDLTGIYKLKEVEGWQKEGDCSAFKKDPAYLATELVKKLKDDLAKIGAM